MIEDNQLTSLVCSRVSNSVATITIPEHIQLDTSEDPSELFKNAVVRLLKPDKNDLCVASLIPYSVSSETYLEYRAYFDVKTPNIFSEDMRDITRNDGYHSSFSINYTKIFDRVYKMDFHFNDYLEGLQVAFESKRHFLFDRFGIRVDNSLIFR